MDTKNSNESRSLNNQQHHNVCEYCYQTGSNCRQSIGFDVPKLSDGRPSGWCLPCWHANQLDALRVLYRVPDGSDIVSGIHARLRTYIDEKYVPDGRAAQVAVAECLTTADPLLAFAAWYSTWLNGNICFAQHWGVTETKLGMGLTLFRVPPFQVQLFLFRAGATIVPHSHPDVESYEVYVGGDMVLTKLGQNVTFPEFVKPNAHGVTECNGGMVRVPAGCEHGGWVNNNVFLPHSPGGAFLSIQYWLNNTIPESIQYNWHGKDGSTKG